MRRGKVLTAGLLMLGASARLCAQEATASVNGGVYTDAQADRGRAAYARNCQMCHGEALGGIDSAPALVGGTFMGNWVGQTIGDLALRVRTTMPLNNPGSLSSAAAADIVALILRSNGYPAGATELPRNAQVLQMFRIDAQKSGG
jgi:quinoprotein glucose dehydrogenase